MVIKMNRSVAAIIAVAVLGGCGQQGAGVEDSRGERESELFKLAHMNGCIECHTVSVSTVGPSWQAIADRYKDAPRAEARALLIESVNKGSKGKWFSWKAPDGMPPLEKRVSAEHIEQLVDYILSLAPSQ